MVGAGDWLGQMGLALQQDSHLLLSSTAIGSSSPSPCKAVRTLGRVLYQDEREVKSNHFRLNTLSLSLYPCQIFMKRPATRQNI